LRDVGWKIRSSGRLPKDRKKALDIANQLGHDDMIHFLSSIN